MQPKEFKKTHKPAACTIDPLESFIPKEIRYETMLKIKHESMAAYGEDLTGECKKRLVCLGKECLGRFLPMASKTAQPYINELSRTQKIVNGELFVTTSCSGCPIVKACNNPCNQINDYIERDRVVEPTIKYQPLSDNIPVEKQEETITEYIPNGIIPWDTLTETREKVVRMYLYEHKDFKYIADILNLNNQAYSKYLFYSSLTILSKFAVMRKFIREHEYELSEYDKILLTCLYEHNESVTEVAERLEKTGKAIQRQLNRIIKIYNIKWKKFVKKKGNKVIYNVPALFK